MLAKCLFPARVLSRERNCFNFIFSKLGTSKNYFTLERFVNAQRFSKSIIGKLSTKAETIKPPSLFRRVGQLYLTLLGANYLSNVWIHPNQKVDYGILNMLFFDERPVDSPFWGTRLPHLFLIPTSLTFFDITITSLFTKYAGLVSFRATPTAWLLNLYVYTWLAVGSFIAFDCAFNPSHKGRRLEQMQSQLKPLTVGMGLQWHANMMTEVFGSVGSGPLALVRNAFAVSLVFFPVKALGFGDFLEEGLSDHERKINGLCDKK